MKLLYFFSIIAIIHLTFTNKKKETNIKSIALIWSIFLIVIYIWILYNFSLNIGEQFNISFFWLNISNTQWGPSSFGLDGISITLIGLALLLKPICVLLTWN